MFIFEISNSFLKKKSTDEAKKFRIKKNKQQGFIEVRISFQMQKNANVLASKLRPVKTCKAEKNATLQDRR